MVAATSVISGGPPSLAAVSSACCITLVSIGGQIVRAFSTSVGSWVTWYAARVGHWLWNDSPTGAAPRGGFT